MLLWDGLRMSVREPGFLPRAHGAQLVVDHISRGWRLMKKKKKLLDFESSIEEDENVGSRAHRRRSEGLSGL